MYKNPLNRLFISWLTQQKFVVLFGLVCLLLQPALAQPLKVAFIHENPVGEGGWTLSHEIARKRIDEHFGGAIITTALDSVSPGVDAERTLTRLARDGNDLVFATSFGFLNATQKVARRFPKTLFEHASGYLTAKNVGTYQVRAYQGRYMSGVAAAKLTKTDRIGYVAPFPIPEVIRGINAFTLGLRSVKPEATVDVVWISTWSDAPRSREAADLLIAKGADIITHHTETSAAIQAADAAGVWSIGYQSDRSKSAPNKHLVSVIHNWFPIYKRKVQDAINGIWTPGSEWSGVEEESTQLVSWGAQVPEEVKKQVEGTRQKLRANELIIFQGPLNDNNGSQQVADNAILDDAALMTMEWLVDGVLGSVPK